MLAYEVKFDRVGFVIIPIYVRNKQTPIMARIDYKVDSGANRTTISRNWLMQLGYDENWIKSGKRLEGNARPTLASGLPLDDCYEIVEQGKVSK